MDRTKWQTRITKACKGVGTYRKEFDQVIETLASVLEKRDTAQEEFDKIGEMVVEHTNKGGNANIEQNPLIRLINDLNRDALTYWRDLGLTPAGLKKINDGMAKVEEKSKLSEVLKNLDS